MDGTDNIYRDDNLQIDQEGENEQYGTEPTEGANSVTIDTDIEHYVVSIVVTREQQEVIQAVFMHNDWDYMEVGEREQYYRNQDGDEEEIPGMIIPQIQDADECQYCLCKPCITDVSNSQLWWEQEPQEPHTRNSGIRKGVYKRFWTMLFHRMAWNDPRYMAKKAAVLNQDANRRYNVWAGGRLNKRDIMPECVLKVVRGWYPNPAHLQYMGHRWG